MEHGSWAGRDWRFGNEHCLRLNMMARYRGILDFADFGIPTRPFIAPPTVEVIETIESELYDDIYF